MWRVEASVLRKHNRNWGCRCLSTIDSEILRAGHSLEAYKVYSSSTPLASWCLRCTFRGPVRRHIDWVTFSSTESKHVDSVCTEQQTAPRIHYTSEICDINKSFIPLRNLLPFNIGTQLRLHVRLSDMSIRTTHPVHRYQHQRQSYSPRGSCTLLMAGRRPLIDLAEGGRFYSMGPGNSFYGTPEESWWNWAGS